MVEERFQRNDCGIEAAAGKKKKSFLVVAFHTLWVVIAFVSGKGLVLVVLIDPVLEMTEADVIVGSSVAVASVPVS